MRRLFALLCVVSGACYRPGYSDCEVQCSSGHGCPSGLTCDPNNMQCRTEGALGAECPGADAPLSDGLIDAPACAPVDIVANGEHTCVLRTDGRVLCWGDDQAGETGVGPSQATCPTIACNPSPSLITMLPPAQRLGLAVAASCAIVSPGNEMWCWGDNRQQQFGNGIAGSDQVNLAPRNVDRPNVRTIAAGDAHSCTLDTYGVVACSSENTSSQVGNNQITPIEPSPLTVALSATSVLAAGFQHTCAISTSNPRISCWGANQRGQSDPATTTNPTGVPKVVSGTAGAKALALGSRHTCFIDSNDGAECFGDNSVGQLGRTPLASSAQTLGPVVGLPAEKVTQLVANYAQTCALMQSGNVYCWGQGEGNPSGLPRRVLSIPTATKIAVGSRHACAIGTDNKVRCWGANDKGHHGDGTTAAGDLPPSEAVVCP